MNLIIRKESMMTSLEFFMYTRRMPVKFDIDMMNETLSKSKGEPTMSIEDLKLSILNLKGIVEHQQIMIERLASELDKKTEKRSRWNPFKK